VPTVLAALKKMSPERKIFAGLETPRKKSVGKTLEELIDENITSAIVTGYISSNVDFAEKLYIRKPEESSLLFEGSFYPMTREEAYEKISVANIELGSMNVAENILEEKEGDFSLIILNEKRIVAARDPLGVVPLYYGENNFMVALASNKKALWNLGIQEPKCFPPGNVAVASNGGFKFKPVRTLIYPDPKYIGLEEASQILQRILECSIRKRISDLKKVAVAFSGGLDSSLVAFLANKCGAEVQLIYVSLENQTETQEALKAAEDLDLPIRVHLFKLTDVEKVISRVVWLVEEPDPVKTSIGIPFYWTAEKAAETGFRVLLAGQGADELFGGYQRYVTEYIREGDEKVRKTMFQDVFKIHENNTERDAKICNFHDIELRLPFGSFELAQFALCLPTELKFEKRIDSLRKLVLRKAAKNLGIPDEIADKPKRAVQYSTGINNALKKIAKEHNVSIGEYVNQLFLKAKIHN
jgi:asparagine synthase (glutamine-hydrolysing)